MSRHTGDTKQKSSHHRLTYSSSLPRSGPAVQNLLLVAVHNSTCVDVSRHWEKKRGPIVPRSAAPRGRGFADYIVRYHTFMSLPKPSCAGPAV